MAISQANRKFNVKSGGDGELDVDTFEIEAEKEDLHNKIRDTFGFILHGTKTMGVYVKEIRGGSLIEKEGRLRIGDQLIQIGDLTLVGMTAEQVVRVLKIAIQMHSKTTICVIHQTSRGKGIGWRPRTPNMANSISDSHLAEEVISHNMNVHDPHHMRRRSLENIVELKQTSAVMEKIPDDLDDKVLKVKNAEISTNNINFSDGVEYPAIPNVPNDDLTRQKIRARRPKKNTVAIEGRQSSSSGSLADSISTTTTRTTGSSSKWDRFSPKFQYKENVPDEIEDLNLETDEIEHELGDCKHAPDVVSLSEEDQFYPTKPTNANVALVMKSPRKGAENVKEFLNRNVRKKPKTNEVLPLVSFDQLSLQGHSPFPKDTGTASRTGSAESKNSKGSNQLSWHCPVCLDGPARIASTERRLMSTGCGHVFCSRCINDVWREKKSCPTCRGAVRRRDLHPIFM